VSAAGARRERAVAALLGALVADAAALGLHWLYDPERIAGLAGPLVFRRPDPADFAGARGVFVHGGKRAGDLSQYGMRMRVQMQALAAAGGAFEPEAAQDRYAAAFGPGGSWTGYIDRPTRGALENLAAGRRAPSGIEDDQLPALAGLVPLLCRPGGAEMAEIDAAVAMTNTGEAARDWSRAAARMIAAALAGAGTGEALAAGEAGAPEAVAAGLARARGSGEADPVVFAGEVGRACHLSQGVPVVAHILRRAADARAAVEANIRAGGDSCGRAILLGALLGACRGVGGAGLPAEWLPRLSAGAALADEIAAVTGEG
jgi:ADP-ribosylglycohydrolase